MAVNDPGGQQTTDATFCCAMMVINATTTCEVHPNRFDCPDALIDYSRVFDEYGIIIHDGGSSVITIGYCPWCGTQLPDSKRMRWFDELERLGVDDPWGDDADAVPDAYRSDAWYRS